jgi:hypothetical protein
VASRVRRAVVSTAEAWSACVVRDAQALLVTRTRSFTESDSREEQRNRVNFPDGCEEASDALAQGPPARFGLSQHLHSLCLRADKSHTFDSGQLSPRCLAK